MKLFKIEQSVPERKPLPLYRLEFIVQEAGKKYKDYNFLTYENNRSTIINFKYPEDTTIILFNYRYDGDKYWNEEVFDASMSFKECMELVDTLVFFKKDWIKKQKYFEKEIEQELENWKKGELK